jgi:hypothetical protein
LLLITLLLISSRFFLEWYENGVCKDSACFVDPFLRVFIDTLPGFLARWLDALIQNPMWLWGFVISYGLFFKIRSKAWTATQNHAMSAWSKLKKNVEPPAWKESFTFKLRQLARSSLKKVVIWTGAIFVFLVILYLFFALINGIIFHLRYTAGWLCNNSNTATVNTAPRITSFDISDSCSATSIRLEQGKTYRFDVNDADLYDGANNPSGPDGYSKKELLPFVPLRRHITEPWIKLYGKVDNGGDETFVLGKGITEYTVRGNGELFLYVNDAVFGVLPEWDLPYRWEAGKNTGMIKVTVSALEQIKKAK